VFPLYYGVGTVGVAFVEDNDDDIIPVAAKVTEVQNEVDKRKPVHADVTVFAPIPHVVDLTIQLKPNTPSVQAAVQAELADLFKREAEVAGAYETVNTTYTGKISLSKINEAISIADGEEDHVVETPTEDVVPFSGHIAVLGEITWQDLT
jgi:uncharacterized phage protein gp47/JayE